MNEIEQVKQLQERIRLLEETVDSLRKKLSQAHSALAEEYIKKTHTE